jgi:hypothetical protein
LFKKLQDEGMKPDFEADVALKYNPYPDPKYKIQFKDDFWHLNHETIQDSFCRLLARQRFSGLGYLLRSLFGTVDEAIGLVRKNDTLDALLNEVKVVVLTKNPELGMNFKGFKGRFNANSYPEFGRQGKIGNFDVFTGRQIRFYNHAQTILSDAYIQFIAALRDAQQHRVQPRKW